MVSAVGDDSLMLLPRQRRSQGRSREEHFSLHLGRASHRLPSWLFFTNGVGLAPPSLTLTLLPSLPCMTFDD